MERNATTYFKDVCELMTHTDVTRHGGARCGLDEGTAAVVARLIDIRRSGNKVMLVGNGGSASIAGHMQMDFSNRASIRAMVFDAGPVLTALSNDHGYEHAFERQVSRWADPGDLLLSISSSGRSENILLAVRRARELGCGIVTFSGFKDANPLRELGDYNFYVGSSHYGEVEVAHHTLGHYLTDCAVAHAEANPE